MQVLTRKITFHGALCAAMLFAGFTSHAKAQTRPWTSVGSTGTVDETDTSEVRFVQGEAQQSSAVPIGTVSTVRYNVVATNDLGGGFVIPRLTVRYRTGDSTGRVIARLKRYNYSPGGAASTMVTLDSNSYPATGGSYVTRSIVNCAAPTLDFPTTAYFIEVELQKNGVNGIPAVGVLKVDAANCIP